MAGTAVFRIEPQAAVLPSPLAQVKDVIDSSQQLQGKNGSPWEPLLCDKVVKETEIKAQSFVRSLCRTSLVSLFLELHLCTFTVREPFTSLNRPLLETGSHYATLTFLELTV